MKTLAVLAQRMLVKHKELEGIKCPRCQGALESGFIAGHWTRLRWALKEKTYTIFAGTPLMKKASWLHAPTVSAKRCKKCKLGVFSYDN